MSVGRNTQPWIFSARFDLGFIVGPALVITALIALLQNHLTGIKDVPAGWWLALIVGIDAAHVYSTLFRTYLDKREMTQRRTLYTLVPLVAWIIGCLLYSIGDMVFWRVLTYMAVFHFIRQQFGFMMIYGRQERNLPQIAKTIDKAAIYMATIYPLVYWHLHRRPFDWFMKDDFIRLDIPNLGLAAAWLYVLVLSAYVVKEGRLTLITRQFNWPKNLLLLGTGMSWFVGIVVFDSDFAFTAINIIAHGVLYMALIWVFGHNQHDIDGHANAPYVVPWIQYLFNWRAVPLYAFALFALAFFEEGLWDGLVWHEHDTIFKASTWLPILPSHDTLVWLVPLLALPQATHYILDAYIWRMKITGTNWKQVLFHNLRDDR